MSEVRTCSECGLQEWASSAGSPLLRTVETVEDGLVVDSEDRVLCRSCFEDLSD
jgi:hypothetical protein